MRATVEVIDENRIDLQNRTLVIPPLHNITDRQGSGISAILKISWIECVLADLVEDSPGSTPRGKCRRVVSRLSTPDILVLVVFLAALNDSIGDNILHSLYDLGLRSRNRDSQTHPKAFRRILVASVQLSSEPPKHKEVDRNDYGERTAM